MLIGAPEEIKADADRTVIGRIRRPLRTEPGRRETLTHPAPS